MTFLSYLPSLLSAFCPFIFYDSFSVFNLRYFGQEPNKHLLNAISIKFDICKDADSRR